jgi:hypothetical protein
VAAKAVHQNEWQQKLFIRTSGSESCSSERVAAKAVHQNEWQRKLFIRTSGSESCSSGLRKQQGLFNESTVAAASRKGCLLRRHQHQLSESSTDFLRRPIRQGGDRSGASKAVVSRLSTD